MKYKNAQSGNGARKSLPVRGAWIEIITKSALTYTFTSLPVRGAWIEMSALSEYRRVMLSLPVRGAWIEIDSTDR